MIRPPALGPKLHPAHKKPPDRQDLAARWQGLVVGQPALGSAQLGPKLIFY